MDNGKILNRIKKYGITFAVMVVITIGVIISRGYSFDSPAFERYRILADAFTIPAMLSILVGTLIWVSTTGFFDFVSYSITVGFRTHLPFSRQEKAERYYDYKVRKNQKRFSGYGFLLISGAIYLVIAIIFNALFNLNY